MFGITVSLIGELTTHIKTTTMIYEVNTVVVVEEKRERDERDDDERDDDERR